LEKTKSQKKKKKMMMMMMQPQIQMKWSRRHLQPSKASVQEQVNRPASSKIEP
jgi:hypothetical protein